MVLEETFGGDFNSPEDLEKIIRFVCGLPGCHEMVIRSQEGKEGILQFADNSVRNAACLAYSGIRAVAEMLWWEKGTYRLEGLAQPPPKNIAIPVKELITRALDMKNSTAESRIEPRSEADQGSISRIPARVEKGKILEGISSMHGVKGVLIASSDGVLLAASDKESADEPALMIALLGEALHQAGKQFDRGEFLHGAVETISNRILIHNLGDTFLGTFISSDSSAALIGSGIEQIITSKENKAQGSVDR